MGADRLSPHFSYSPIILLLVTVLSTQPLQAQALPPVPYVIANVCQLECCRLGQWSTSFDALAVYRAPGDQGARTTTIPKRTSFVADSSVVVVRRFGVAVADKPVPVPRNAPIEDSTTLVPGDTVYLMRYEGGDWFAAWFMAARRESTRFGVPRNRACCVRRTRPATAASSKTSKRSRGCMSDLHLRSLAGST
jgi:hypothetical protein